MAANNRIGLEHLCRYGMRPPFSHERLSISSDGKVLLYAYGAGKILVAGSSHGSAGNDDMVIWRYNTDGTPDSTFGAGGVVAHHDAAGGSGGVAGMAIVVDGTGRILVAGYSDADPDTNKDNPDMATWRFNPDGTLDPGFGGDGIQTHGGTVGAYNRDAATSIAIDSLGRIVVGGSSSNGPNGDGTIWRYVP